MNVVFEPARFAPNMTCVVLGEEPIGMIEKLPDRWSASCFKAKSTIHTPRKGLAIKFIIDHYQKANQTQLNLF